MENEFSRQRLMDNISALIQRQGLKVGEVEAAVGISTGYLGKLVKKDTDAAPTSDLVWRLANHFGVSTDLLIGADLTHIPDQLLKLEKFFNKLQRRTENGILVWTAITTKQCDAALNDEQDASHPLVRTKNEITFKQPKDAPQKPTEPWGPDADQDPNNTSMASSTFRRLTSAACPESDIWQVGNAYHATIGDNKQIFLFYLHADFDTPGGPTEACFYDVYMQEMVYDSELSAQLQQDAFVPKLTPICNTLNNAAALTDVISFLMRTIEHHEYDIHLPENVETTIDAFLDEEE